ncbi:aminotransferase class IV family protein [bacterium]|nr:aminotransferase class IV family protein [bacterium]MBU1995340.1 aminotransferase class IV family protein [bacterium]
MNNSFLETIRAVDGDVFHMPYHQKRYESVLHSLGIDKVENLKEHLYPPEKGLYRCRVVYTPHAINVTYHPYKKKDIRSLKLVYDDKIEYSLKSTNRDKIDALFEMKQGCDDILIVKKAMITDTSIANIAFFDSKVWLTPKKPLLKGTTRARLLDKGKIFEADIRVEDLDRFSKVALLNSMIDFDIIPITKVREFIC